MPTECDDLYEKARAAVLAVEEAGFKQLETKLRTRLKALGLPADKLTRNTVGDDCWGYGFRKVSFETCGVTLYVSNRDSWLHAETPSYYMGRNNTEFTPSGKTSWDTNIKTLADLEAPLRYAREYAAKKAEHEAKQAAQKVKRRRLFG